MKREDIQKANQLEESIQIAEQNIQKFKELGEQENICISTLRVDSEIEPIFISGEAKDLIINILIERETIWMNERITELENL
jgi:3-dehydroquinate synthase class II